MISLLCPTRGRPSNMTRFVESALATADDPRGVEIVWYIDRDDEPSIDTAIDLQLCATNVQSIACYGPRIVLSQCWNHCAENASGRILGHMGDDIVFRTQGWDAKVREAFDRFPDRIAFVHGRDGVHDERLGTHGFISREWYEAVGRFAWPNFSHDYCDTWLHDVANAIGRSVFLADVLTEHRHPDVGLAEYDQTYRDHAEAGRRDGVADLYASLAGERELDAMKLRAAIREFECASV